LTEQDVDILITQCTSGNRRAQQQLYQQLYGFAMSISMRYAIDKHEAADIMSHSFVKMFRSLNSFNTAKGSIYAWLKKIVINEAIDLIKKRSQFSIMEIETVAEPSISNSFIEKIEAAALMDIIKKLPPATHAVFVLYAIDGYAHKEIAIQLQISEGTSKWHLSEARKFLQQKIQGIKK